MDFQIPNNISALRKEEDFGGHSVTLDPYAFRKLISYVDSGLRMGQIRAEFMGNISRQTFEEMIPEDPALYDAFGECFDQAYRHCREFEPALDEIRRLGRHLMSFAENGHNFLNQARFIMDQETSLDTAMDLSSLCQNFISECREFENYLSPIFQQVISFKVLSSQDATHIKTLNTRWDNNFPSQDRMHDKARAKAEQMMQAARDRAPPEPSIWEKIFSPGGYVDRDATLAALQEEARGEIQIWADQLERAYTRFKDVDRSIDLAVEGASGSEMSLSQLKGAIAAIITDCEGFHESINRVVERMREGDEDSGDLDVLMEISHMDVDSASETWALIGRAGEQFSEIVNSV